MSIKDTKSVNPVANTSDDSGPFPIPVMGTIIADRLAEEAKDYPRLKRVWSSAVARRDNALKKQEERLEVLRDELGQALTNRARMPRPIACHALTETELYILTVLNAKKRPGTHVPANCDRVGENEPCRSQNDETA